MPDNKTVLVVGGTGAVGSQVVKELLRLGKTVRALVRPASDASKLEAQGVTIMRGDMLDLPSLVQAMTGADAVVTTAAGYTKHSAGDTEETDRLGNRNLVDAARQTGIKRFVLTSILTADQTPNVPHFWDKKLAEDYLQQQGVPFVALRPGAFLDTLLMGDGPDGTLRLVGLGSEDTPLTFILQSQIGRYLARAVDADVAEGERIDIGWEQPVSVAQLKIIAEQLRGPSVSLWVLPSWLLNSVGALVGYFNTQAKDVVTMAQWFETGRFVSQPQRQREVFGEVPTAATSVRELLETRKYHLGSVAI